MFIRYCGIYIICESLNSVERSLGDYMLFLIVQHKATKLFLIVQHNTIHPFSIVQHKTTISLLKLFFKDTFHCFAVGPSNSWNIHLKQSVWSRLNQPLTCLCYTILILPFLESFVNSHLCPLICMFQLPLSRTQFRPNSSDLLFLRFCSLWNDDNFSGTINKVYKK